MAYFQYISKLHIYHKDRKKQPKAEKPYVILGCSWSQMISSSSCSSFAWFFCSDVLFRKTLLNASGFFLLFPPFSANPFRTLKFMPKIESESRSIHAKHSVSLEPCCHWIPVHASASMRSEPAYWWEGGDLTLYFSDDFFQMLLTQLSLWLLELLPFY